MTHDARLLTLASAVLLLAAACPAARAADNASTAIMVTPIDQAHVVRGDDGRDHVEYDLLVTNAFTAPVTIKSVDVLTGSGRVLLHMEGDALNAATQTILEGKPLTAIPASGSAALEVDLILPPDRVPPKVSHRIAYDFAPDAPAASIVGSRQVNGPDVTINRERAIQIISPLTGTSWVAVNGCCTPNIHRNVRVAAGTRIATAEIFAIDWVELQGGKLFTGDGKKNEDYAYFGAPLRAVANGEIVGIRNDMPEQVPFAPATGIDDPRDYGGNYVLLRIEPDVYAFYAHIQPGTISVKAGDHVRAGQVIGKLGNSGNSTNPHLHFGLLDRPDFLIGTSLPFVIDHFRATGIVTGGNGDTVDITPQSIDARSAYPLVNGVADFK